MKCFCFILDFFPCTQIIKSFQYVNVVSEWMAKTGLRYTTINTMAADVLRGKGISIPEFGVLALDKSSFIEYEENSIYCPCEGFIS